MWPSLGKSTISAHQLKSTFYWPIRESYIHALTRNTKCLTIDGQVCFYRRPFSDAVEPWGCISWPWGALTNRTAWGTKLLLTAVMSSPVDCISLCQILKAQHCSLSLNGGSTPPSAPHPPPPPTSPPSHLLTPYRLNRWYYRSWKKPSE